MNRVAIGVAAALAGVVTGVVVKSNTFGKKLASSRKVSDKYLSLFLLTNQWLKMKQEGKSLVSFFEKEGYRTIAIYGMSRIGERLTDELYGSGVNVRYGIDKNTANIYLNLKIVSPEDELEQVDAIVVTAIVEFEDIKDALAKKIGCPIFSIDEIIMMTNEL